MARPPINGKSDRLFRLQLDAALDYIEANGGSGGGSPSWSSITGKPSTFPPEAHTHPIANVTGLQTALDGKADAGAAGASPAIAWVI